jgi:L-aminopeptidase/D-esterase-like protein
VLLTGGSAFGLDAAGGVMKSLEEARVGRDVSVTVVPNVCATVLFDLKCGYANIRPDAVMGYAACEAALKGEGMQNGCFGAGTGATLGKVNGLAHAMKGGIGAVALRQGELMVGAVIAVNCVGDVLERGQIIAGCRAEALGEFADSERIFLERYERQRDVFSGAVVGGNTVIGCIVTNASLTKAQANKLASVGHNGLARAIRPAHTTFDGDTLFAMSYGSVCADPDAVGILAALAVEQAIIQGVREAKSMHGFPALCDLP